MWAIHATRSVSLSLSLGVRKEGRGKEAEAEEARPLVFGDSFTTTEQSLYYPCRRNSRVAHTLNFALLSLKPPAREVEAKVR